MKLKSTTLIAVLFAVLFVFTACQSANINETTPSSTSATNETTAATTVLATEETLGFYQADVDTFAVESKYGDLRFPKVWENCLEVDISEGEVYTMTFFLNKDSFRQAIFDLIFGESEAYTLGTLTTDNGDEIDIHIVNYEFMEDELTPEQYEDCCAMAEDVNVIISKLIESGNFVLAE